MSNKKNSRKIDWFKNFANDKGLLGKNGPFRWATISAIKMAFSPF